MINAGEEADAECVELYADALRMFESVIVAMTADVADVEGGERLRDRFLVALQHHDGDGRDPEKVAAFLSEGMDQVMDADQMLAAWAANPGDTTGIEALRQELTRVASSANAAGIADAAELADLFNDCCGAAVQRQRSACRLTRSWHCSKSTRSGT